MATIRARAPWLAKLLERVGDLVRSDGPSAVAGLLGALASVIVMGFFRFAWGTTSLPELVGERILPLLPVDLFIKLLVTFAPNSKTGPLGLSLLGQIVLGVVLGPLFHRIARTGDTSASRWPTRRALIVAGAFVAGMELLSLLLFWPVLGESLVGVPIDGARLITSVANLVIFAAFMGVTLLADTWLRADWLTNETIADVGTSERAVETAPLGLKPRDPSSGVSVGEAADDEAEQSGPPSPADVEAQSPTAHLPDDQEMPSQPVFAPALLSRRQVIGKTGATVLAVGAGLVATEALIGAWYARSNLAYEGAESPAQIRSAITPIEDFYVVSKNALDPEVIADKWQLELRGLVQREGTWTYKQVRALPSETRAITMECISNPVGHHLMSTAEWTGIQLGTLLQRQGGVTTAGKYVIFTSVDGFQSSLPLADLLEARTLLAWGMNGQNLPTRHGFPLRVIVPGRYGEQSAKWLTRIEVVDKPFKGFYQSQGWSDHQLETTSRIDLPGGRVPLGPVTVMGIAFAGIRRVEKVEVSADGGATWNAATLIPPLSDQSWVFWQWAWQPPARGKYTLMVRATDGTGTVQTSVKRGQVPAGATGWHTVKVQVA